MKLNDEKSALIADVRRLQQDIASNESKRRDDDEVVKKLLLQCVSTHEMDEVNISVLISL